MKRFILFALIIFSQCAWEYPNGWDSGAIKPPSIIYPGTVATTNATLTVGQSGNTIIYNAGTGSGANDTQFTLPTAVVGMDYIVVADIAKWFAMIPQSTDIINFSTATTGDGVKNSGSAAIGDSIELICQTAGKWSIKNKSGTWSVGK